jgi:hypothetical protein
MVQTGSSDERAPVMYDVAVPELKIGKLHRILTSATISKHLESLGYRLIVL